jgi:hypothetical protein
MIIARLRVVHAWLERWLASPEPRAAGRLGLFRILYSLFYLWHLSWIHAADLGRLPPASWHPVGVLRLFGVEAPSMAPAVLEPLLVGLLVLLMVGLWVRGMTAAVLVSGLLLETFHGSYGKVEHSTVFPVFYIPLFMTASTWGESWSLDALLQRRTDGTVARTDDGDWRNAWPIRATLFMLVALFASATVAKCVFGGWVVGANTVPNLLLDKNVEAVLNGVPINPLAPLVATTPPLSQACRWGLLLFEALFMVVLLGGPVRDAYLALALVFHALNGLLLVVTFTPILITYALFVDLHGMARRLEPLLAWPARVLDRTPSALLVWSAIGLALLVAASWNATPVPRTLLQLDGVLDWRTIWYPVLPVAVVWCRRECAALVRESLWAKGSEP